MNFGRVVGLALLGLALAASQSAAAEGLAPEQVRKAVEEAYGVTVLKAEPVETEAGPAYKVVMMNPGGDRNDAFAVNTILVDAATGRKIPAFRHRTSGYDLPEAPSNVPNRQSVTVPREGQPWR